MNTVGTLLSCAAVAVHASMIGAVIMQKITNAGTTAQEVRTVVSPNTVEAIREMLCLDYGFDDVQAGDLVAYFNGQPERARTAFLLRGYGFSVQEIGKALGVSHQAVSARIRSMKKNVAARLQNEDFARKY